MIPWEEFLQGKTLVFIGDDSMRSQYLDIVYQLRHGRQLNTDLSPNPYWPGEYGTIDIGGNVIHRYLPQTYKNLYPFEFCDCYMVPDKEKTNPFKHFENRYYYDRDHNIFVVFHHFNGISIRGHFNPWVGFQDFRRVPLHSFDQSLWDLRIDKCIEEKIGRSHHENYAQFFNNTYYLVMNIGHMDLDLYNLNRTDHLKSISQSAVRNYDKFLWKTTTYFRPGTVTDIRWGGTRADHDRRDKIMCDTEGVHCMDISWTKDLSKNDFFDERYVKPDIVRRMNQEMYAILSK